MPPHPDLQAISGRLERGEIDSQQYLEQLMRHVAALIDCSRAGLRIFMDGDLSRIARCVAMYDRGIDRMVAAVDIVHPAGGAYLERLQGQGHVSAGDALHDAVIDGSYLEYVKDRGIASLMDMSFSVNGVLFGVFSCEQTGVRVEFTQRQLQALRKMASRASLSLMHAFSASMDSTPAALWETSVPNRLVTLPMPLDD